MLTLGAVAAAAAEGFVIDLFLHLSFSFVGRRRETTVRLLALVPRRNPAREDLTVYEMDVRREILRGPTNLCDASIGYVWRQSFVMM